MSEPLVEIASDTVNSSVTVGIVMPIAPIENYSADHWVEVKQIITESIIASEKYQMNINLVSDAEDIGIIQKRIIQNLFMSDVIICDVSGKNPNVMFELGMRLAFDKPVVIIKDSDTGYSFDTGIIEHLDYPRDLRFQRIVAFKKKLLEKTERTLEIARQNPEASSFLNNFAIAKAGILPQKDAKIDDIVLEAVSDLQKEVRMLRNRFELNQTLDVKQYFDLYSSESIKSNNIYSHDVNSKKYESVGRMIESRIKSLTKESNNISFEQILNTVMSDDFLRKSIMNKYNLEATEYVMLLHQVIANSMKIYNKN